MKKKTLEEEISDIRKLAGLPGLGELDDSELPISDQFIEQEGDNILQFDAAKRAQDANRIEDRLNDNLPNLPDKRLMADFNDQYGTIEVWIETEDVTTVIEIKAIEKAINMVQQAHFIGVEPLSNGIKLIFTIR